MNLSSHSKILVDFGKTAKDYARHRAGFPESFFDRINELNLVTSATTALDIGTGTGTVARGLAKMGADVVGSDPSPALMEEAKTLDKNAGVKIRYHTAKAESTGLAEHSFDLVTAGQCWHWFAHEEAVKEIRRLLKPNGKLMICYFDWLEEPNSPVEEMKKLQRKYNPAWKTAWGFYAQKPGDLKLTGFRSIHSFLYEEKVPYSHEDWRGRMRAYAGIGGSLPPRVVEAFDQEFSAVLRAKFPNEPMQIPHKVWAEIWQLLP